MMTNPVIATLVFQSEMLIAYIFFSNIAEKRCPAWQCLLIGVSLFELGAVINVLAQNVIWINIVNTILILIVFPTVCYYLPLRQSVFYSLVLMAINFGTEMVMISAVSAFTDVLFAEYQTDAIIFLLECPASKLLYLLCTLALSRIVKPTQGFHKIPFILYLHPAAMLANFIGLSYICITYRVAPAGHFLVAALSTIIFFITLLLVVYYQRQVEKDNENMRIQSEFRRLQTEKVYYDILDQQNQQLRIYVHDTRNHLAAIQSLNTDPRISEYIEKLSGCLETYSQGCQSGNKLLDIMLNKYTKECAQLGIDFSYNVKLYNLSDVEDMDLVAILGNLMDNAVEAAKKTAQKKIYLETSYRNAYRVLMIENSSLPPQADSGHLITSKHDHSLHGYGLKSVAKTLKKYQGDLQWDYNADESTFTMTVMIGKPSGNTPN